jgi:hypothetical protein
MRLRSRSRRHPATYATTAANSPSSRAAVSPQGEDQSSGWGMTIELRAKLSAASSAVRMAVSA